MYAKKTITAESTLVSAHSTFNPSTFNPSVSKCLRTLLHSCVALFSANSFILYGLRTLLSKCKFFCGDRSWLQGLPPATCFLLALSLVFSGLCALFCTCASLPRAPKPFNLYGLRTLLQKTGGGGYPGEKIIYLERKGLIRTASKERRCLRGTPRFRRLVLGTGGRVSRNRVQLTHSAAPMLQKGRDRELTPKGSWPNAGSCG